MADDPILQSLGRMEGKLDAALQRLGGHDNDIERLREQQGRLSEAVTKVATTLKVAWGAIGLVMVALGIVASVVSAR